MVENTCGSKSCSADKNCGCCCKCVHSALIVSGIIFGLMALMHAYRLFHFFPVVFGTVMIGYDASVAILIISALLSLWMFWSAVKYCNSCKRCRCGCHNPNRVDVINRDREVNRDINRDRDV